MFTERHERVVVAIAAQGAVAIDNARLYAAEQLARAEAEEAADRLERLQGITARLSQARSLEDVSEVVVTTAAAGVGADSAMVAGVSRDGRHLSVLSVIGYDEDVVGQFMDMSLDDPVPAAEAVRTGELLCWSSPQERAARWPVLANEPGRGVAGVAVPLLGTGRAVGVAGFSWRSPQRFTDEELAFLSVVARQSGQAIERAQQYDASILAARTLQRTLLPPSMPVIDGLTIAARYQPVADGSVVGGDFYDAFRRTPGSWGIVIGDVSGKGVQAASLTSLVRHTVRALGRRMTGPDEVLIELNDAILAEELDDRFATVIYLVAEPSAAGVDLRFTVGGHPLPLHRTPDGRVRAVGTPGGVVGLLADPKLTVDRLTLRTGEMLLLYTDGFIEGRAPDGAFADELLAEAVSASKARSADELADELTTLLIEFQDGRPRDDMALLVLEATPVV
jgi:GAF domain-containing protein